MTLVAFNVTAAVKSPCVGCEKKSYPSCRIACGPINGYLAHIGLPPHEEDDDDDDLAERYPSSRRGKSDKPRKKIGPRHLMSEMETKAATKRLLEIMMDAGMPKCRLAKVLGVSRTYFNAIVDGKFARIGKKFHDIIFSYPIGGSKR